MKGEILAHLSDKSFSQQTLQEKALQSWQKVSDPIAGGVQGGAVQPWWGAGEEWKHQMGT